MKDHIYSTKLDLGVLGERDAEVFYDWTPPNPSNDPFQVPENGGATIARPGTGSAASRQTHQIALPDL